MNKTYLCIDTTTEACSVALGVGDECLSRYTEEPRMHAKLVLPMVDELLAEAGMTLGNLGGIAFCQGPGAFTGLRIGAGVVQGLAFSADLPVIGVSTLATLAQRAFREYNATHVHVAIDARMGEIYWSSYIQKTSDNSAAVWQLLGEEVVIKPDNVPLHSAVDNNADWIGCGSGWALRDELQITNVTVSKTYESLLPHAIDALCLASPLLDSGRGVAAEFAQPHYVRNNVAKKKAEQGSPKASV